MTGWTPDIHATENSDAIGDFIGPDMERRNCELSDSFAFIERDEMIAAKYGYCPDSDTAKTRRAGKVAAWNRDHTARLSARLDREAAQARKWTAETVASLRRAGEHRAAELVEARARHFEAERLKDRRA